MNLALILTHDRPGLLCQCVAAIGPQVDIVIIIDNASDPVVKLDDLPQVDAVQLLMTIPDQPPNLSKLWAMGLRVAASLASRSKGRGPHRVAILCDDAMVPPGWMAAVCAAMTRTGASAGCSDPMGHLSVGQERVKLAPDHALMERMPGWAFVLELGRGVEPDERFHWWWGDTDVDWQARRAGGTVMIGGSPVPNLRPNDFLVNMSGLSQRAGLDGEAFEAKWGSPRPW